MFVVPDSFRVVLTERTTEDDWALNGGTAQPRPSSPEVSVHVERATSDAMGARCWRPDEGVRQGMLARAVVALAGCAVCKDALCDGCAPRDAHPGCPGCRCGKLVLAWSDREHVVTAEDTREVAEAVVACALDHVYDRTKTGVPNGLPQSIVDLLAPIVARRLEAMRPEWTEQREDFVLEVQAALWGKDMSK